MPAGPANVETGRSGTAWRSPKRERSLPMGGWLLWGLVLPVLLVVAGIITIRRRRNGR
jgi:hypothetical protein